MSWISRLANSLRPEHAAADLADELQFHLEQRAADLVRGGLSPAEAERVARLQLGNALQLRESSRDVKSAVWIESLLLDFRFGLRMISKYRKASLAAIASLALAVGACTAAFTLVDALIFRPLPIPAPHQLVDLARLLPPLPCSGQSVPRGQLLQLCAISTPSRSGPRAGGSLRLDHRPAAPTVGRFRRLRREHCRGSYLRRRVSRSSGVPPSVRATYPTWR